MGTKKTHSKKAESLSFYMALSRHEDGIIGEPFKACCRGSLLSIFKRIKRHGCLLLPSEFCAEKDVLEEIKESRDYLRLTSQHRPYILMHVYWDSDDGWVAIPLASSDMAGDRLIVRQIEASGFLFRLSRYSCFASLPDSWAATRCYRSKARFIQQLRLEPSPEDSEIQGEEDYFAFACDGKVEVIQETQIAYMKDDWQDPILSVEAIDDEDE